MKLHKKPSLGLGLLGATVLLPGIAAAAVDVPTSFGNGADTYLTNDESSGPDVPHGTSTTMEMRQMAVRQRILYIRFDISAVSGDLSGATITLNGTTVNRNRPLNFRGVLDGTTDGQGENWNEETVTYADAAGVDPFAPLNTFAFSAAATPNWIAHTSGSAVGLNVTAASTDLNDFIAADTDGLITFIVNLEEVVNGSEDFFFQTKEAGGITPFITFPNASADDTDGDGLADGWELANFGDLSKTGDEDSDTDDGLITGNPMPDGFTNEEEETAGSDPLNHLSVPSDIDADGLADLWEDANFGNNNSIIEPGDINPQDGLGDPDSDWGSNEDEETAGSDPNDRGSFLDADADLQNDWWEIQYFTDTATSASGSENSDADGFDNDAEYAAYSDPTLPNSVPGDIDGDGVPDIWEDQYYGNNDGVITDINAVADLDGTDGTLDNEPDGFTDSQEANAVVPSNPFDANSVPGDADGDNLDDSWEIANFPGSTIFDQNGFQDSDGDLYSNEEEESAVPSTDPLDEYSFVEDTDSDSQNDRWEILYFGNLTTSSLSSDDIDGDLSSNDDEYFYGSNPNDINSTPEDVDGDGLPDTDEFGASWYELLFFDDIYTFDGNDDPDGDYSTNAEELAAGTAPNDRAIAPDTDGDTLGDGWENFSFGNLTTTDDPLGNEDGDNYDNGTEYLQSTNGNDPLSTPDDDGDGLPEGFEISVWGDPATQTGLDDSDGGGANNLIEFLAGTNPDNGSDDPTPAELTTAIGNGADTMVTNDNQNAGFLPTTTHGSDGRLQARNNTDARQRVTLLRFDTSTLSGDLSNLMLQINCTAAPRTRSLPIYGLVDGDPGENWDEATTSYLTAPGLIPGDTYFLYQFARDPKKLRFLGNLNIVQGQNRVYLTDPGDVDLTSFVAEDTNGIVTLAIAGVDNNEFAFDSKESAVAPALIAPAGTITLPPTEELAIVNGSLNTTTDIFTMNVEGLVIGQDYHVEALKAGETTFTAVAGSTFTAAATSEAVETAADNQIDQVLLFRISEGVEP